MKCNSSFIQIQLVFRLEKFTTEEILSVVLAVILKYTVFFLQEIGVKLYRLPRSEETH